MAVGAMPAEPNAPPPLPNPEYKEDLGPVGGASVSGHRWRRHRHTAVRLSRALRMWTLQLGMMMEAVRTAGKEAARREMRRQQAQGAQRTQSC